jgi:hypothetical protein
MEVMGLSCHRRWADCERTLADREDWHRLSLIPRPEAVDWIRFLQTDANSKVAVTFALAQCKEHYTTVGMAELRKRYRPEKSRTDDAEGQVYVDR